jgi:hypothetical protein
MMHVSALLSIFRTMLETAVIVRAQYVSARAYGDVEGMRQALESAILIDEDTVSVLDDVVFHSVELAGGKAIPGSPEEIIELMRTMKLLQSANITSLLKTIPGELLDLEEHRQRAAIAKMVSVGNYFRSLKRAMVEQWNAWTPSLQKEFSSMLKLPSSRRKKRKSKRKHR